MVSFFWLACLIVKYIFTDCFIGKRYFICIVNNWQSASTELLKLCNILKVLFFKIWKQQDWKISPKMLHWRLCNHYFFLLSSSSSSYNQIIIEGGAQTLADMTTPPRTGRWEVFGETNPPGTGIGSHHIVICENITSLVDFNKISGW